MSIQFTADQLDQLVQSTLPFYVKDKLFEQADQATPALKKFQSGKKMYPGGDTIIINPKFGRELSMDLITASDQELTFGTVNPLKQARYTWDMNHMGLTFTWQEALQAGFSLKSADDGTFTKVTEQDAIRIQGFITSKFEQFDFDTRHSFSIDRIWSNGTNGFPGVPALITDSPTTGVTGGLSRVSNTLWRNRSRVGASKIAYSAANQTLTQTLRSEMIQLRRYGSANHVAYCGSLFLEALRVEMSEKGVYTQTGFKDSTVDIGINGVSLDGMLFQYEPALDDTGENDRCYIIDHNSIFLYMHSGNDMTMHEPKRPYNVLAYYKSLLWSGAMVAHRLNSSGVYEVVTTSLPSA